MKIKLYKDRFFNRLHCKTMLFAFFVVFLAAAVNAQQTVSFGGHVYSEDFPINKGYAYLYQYEDMSTVFQITEIDTLGYYYFYNVPQDKYIVYAGLSLEDPLFGQFAFTYYPNVALWQHSTPIQPTENTWNYHIHLINQDPEQTFGPGRISGTVDNSMGNVVDMILFDPTLQRIYAHIPVQNDGTFEFDGLPLGDYVLYPHAIGLLTQPTDIHISDMHTEIANLQVFVGDDNIGFVGIEEYSSQDNALHLSHYQTNGNDLTLHLQSANNQDVIYQLYTLTGQQLAQGRWPINSGANAYHITLQNTTPSVVLLQLSNAQHQQRLLSAKCRL